MLSLPSSREATVIIYRHFIHSFLDMLHARLAEEWETIHPLHVCVERGCYIDQSILSFGVEWRHLEINFVVDQDSEVAVYLVVASTMRAAYGSKSAVLNPTHFQPLLQPRHSVAVHLAAVLD
jgi:hypothetical protein